MHCAARLALVLVVLVASGCGDGRSVMTAGNASPSGRYELDVFEDGSEVGFRVTSADGTLVLEPDERRSRRHRYMFVWGEGDVVWAHSSDVGTTVWQPQPNGNWKRALWVDTALTPPAELREAFPREFR